MKTAVVMGAGPAGLSAAYHLAEKGYRVEVIDREPRVGGLGASFKWDDFILDYGPHAFHVKPSPTMDLIDKLFAGRSEELIYQNRDELLYLKGRYFRYPMKFYELIAKLNPFFSLNLIFDFLMSSVIYRYIAVPDDNFESWCIKRFGKSLYRLCFGNYTSKVWGMSPARISPHFAARKIHKLNLKDIILKLLGGKGEEQETYWKSLLYPRYGSGRLFERFGEVTAEKGGVFHLGAEIKRVSVADGKVTGVDIETPGGPRHIPCDLLLSSIPLKYLVGALSPSLGDFFQYSTKLLRYRSLIVVCVAFDQPKVLPVHWIYLVDPSFAFSRLTEQKNMSPDTAVPARSMVACERGCYYGDALWNSADPDLFEAGRKELARIPNVDVSKISGHHVIRMKDAYPVYDLDFDKNLRAVLAGLAGVSNLYSFGRQGMFLQNDMHDSMENGRLLAEHVDQGLPAAGWYESMLQYWKLGDRQAVL